MSAAETDGGRRVDVACTGGNLGWSQANRGVQVFAVADSASGDFDAMADVTAGRCEDDTLREAARSEIMDSA
jgi:hypothetical protein